MKITLTLQADTLDDEMRVELALRAQDLQMALREVMKMVASNPPGKSLHEFCMNVIENLELKHLL